MRGYFKPARRKIGVITLVIACVVMAGWLRSFLISDWLSLYRAKSTEVVVKSKDGSLLWVTLRFHYPQIVIGGISATPSPGDLEIVRGMFSDDVRWSFRFAGIDLGAGTCSPTIGDAAFCILPYWSIVIPLTLISAWLLFSKPRQELTHVNPPLPNGAVEFH